MKFQELSVVLQMDNCRVHWSLEALQFYKDNEITVIDWSPYSPDLNPIENIWIFIKAKLGSKNIQEISWIQRLLQFERKFQMIRLKSIAHLFMIKLENESITTVK